MAEPTTVPQLLQQARLEQGLDLLTLARKAGIAKHQLADIEAASARSFYSLAYCRSAVDKVAQQLGVASRVNDLWQDSDWRDAAPAPELAPASPEIYPPEVIEDEAPLVRKPSSFVGWKLPVFGVLAIALVMAFALQRAGVEPVFAPTPTVQVAAVSPPAPANPTTEQPTNTAVASTPTPSVAPTSGASIGSALANSAPVPAPKAAPEPKVSAQVFRDQVNGAMNDWVRHWKNRDAQAYAQLYSTDFPALARHLSVRQERMQRAAFVEVDVSETSMRQSSPMELTVRFRQRYRSDSFQSDDVKELVWQQTPSGPRIKIERLVN